MADNTTEDWGDFKKRCHSLSEELREEIKQVRRKLQRDGKINNVVYLGIGSVQAHARHNTLEEWVAIWGKVQK